MNDNNKNLNRRDNCENQNDRFSDRCDDKQNGRGDEKRPNRQTNKNKKNCQDEQKNVRNLNNR